MSWLVSAPVRESGSARAPRGGAQLRLAAAVPPRSLAFASFTNPGAVWSLVNGATFVDGTLRLNADEPNASPAAWYPSKLWMDQFNVTVLFSIKAGSSSSNGGLALVIQVTAAAGPSSSGQLAHCARQSDRVGKSGANDAGLGYGMTPTDAGDGISSSLAVVSLSLCSRGVFSLTGARAQEFDTILDAGVDDTVRSIFLFASTTSHSLSQMPDCEPPHISVHTMGNTANSAVEKAARIGCWNSMLNPYSNTSVVHNITLSYSNNLLHVRFDNIGPVVISTEINLVTKLGLNDSLAWLGFTASTGPAGGDVHTIEALFYEYYSNLAPARSTFSGLVSVPAGQLQNVTVNAVDEFGHPYPYGGSALTVALRNATTTQFTYHVFDFANGTYTIQWSSTYAVNDSMVIQMDGADISGSPAAVEVTPLAVEPAQCNTTGSVTYGEAGTVSSFSIHVFDKYRVSKNGDMTEGSAHSLPPSESHPEHGDFRWLHAAGPSWRHHHRQPGSSRAREWCWRVGPLLQACARWSLHVEPSGQRRGHWIPAASIARGARSTQRGQLHRQRRPHLLCGGE